MPDILKTDSDSNSLIRRILTVIWLFFLCLGLFAADVLPVLTEAYLNKAASRYGISAKRQLRQWDQLIRSNRSRSELEKLQIVNNFFNRIRYVSDLAHWRRNDYWSTPAELIASNGGDCEDFAIAKYFTLVAMGVNPEKLRITYVKAIIGSTSIAHMVLTYYSNARATPLVLDNLVKQIKPASQRRDLTPVYAFNGDSLWVSRSSQPGRVGNSNNIRFWREMKSRMGQEF